MQANDDVGEIGFGGFAETQAAGRFKRILLSVSAVALVLVAAVGVSSYFYWQSFKGTPQYSLALIIDAARRNDQASIDKLVDTGAVVDDFMPQITSKAVEIYGRGLPSQTIERVAQVAGPMMPAVKDRARSELPGLIRRKSEKFGNIPFAAMVIGAGRYLDIETSGNAATVKSLLPDHSFEFKMMREGEQWKIVGVKDNELSERIAKAIGQEVIFAATNNGKTPAGERLGIKNLNELLKNAEEALK
ncbi:MAG: hypothetical protein ABI791_15865 [Acidobacteriota bacterium]